MKGEDGANEEVVVDREQRRGVVQHQGGGGAVETEGLPDATARVGAGAQVALERGDVAADDGELEVVDDGIIVRRGRGIATGLVV